MSLERLEKALKGIQSNYSFANEHGLVKAGAKAHGVNLSEGGVFDSLEMTSEGKGAYNARLVKQDEDLEELALGLQKAESLTVICEDYRQSAQVANELGINNDDGKDAILATAGGPTQPMEGDNLERHNSLVEFIIAFHEVNSTALIRLIAHDGVCGGHASYIGTAKKAREAKKEEDLEEAVKAEDTVMIAHVRILAIQLVENKVDKEILKGGLAKVSEENKYQGIKWFDLFTDN